jgi:SAM-dependent methyltransferase
MAIEMTQKAKRVRTCRICGADLPAPFFDLGQQPLANFLLEPTFKHEDVFELALCHCSECKTVQLTQTIAPESLFRDYIWVTGTASTTRIYAKAFFTNVSHRLISEKPVKITEIASNDGTFLKPFMDAGHSVQGIDPARNIAKMANDAGVPTVSDFFGSDIARQLRIESGPSDVIIARNVIPHVADVNDVIAGIEHLLNEKGVGVIEFHDASKIQTELHYDSIYHEHIFYFTLLTLEHLLNRHGLYLFDIEASPISGGSWVVFFSKDAEKQQSSALLACKKSEKNNRINELNSWLGFATSCEQHALELFQIDKGQVVAGYGASARSSTMLNYCKLSHNNIAHIADKNPMKQGLLAPGTHIPIEDPSRVFNNNVDVVLLCAWNFKEEIVEFLRNEMSFSGDIILPLPNSIEII